MATQSPISLFSLEFPDGFDTLEQIISGYKWHMVLVSALQCGIFDYLEKSGGSTREELV